MLSKTCNAKDGWSQPSIFDSSILTSDVLNESAKTHINIVHDGKAAKHPVVFKTPGQAQNATDENNNRSSAIQDEPDVSVSEKAEAGMYLA